MRFGQQQALVTSVLGDVGGIFGLPLGLLQGGGLGAGFSMPPGGWQQTLQGFNQQQQLAAPAHWG